eukprot:m.264586 g.264586  ORF g.264586 m.264586 type:complete len:308 (+) comp40472_c3_seq1:1303-2226(+)
MYCENIADTARDSRISAEAKGLLFKITKMDFVLAVIVLSDLLTYTNHLSKYLQSPKIELMAAVSSVRAVQRILSKQRTVTQFEKYFQQATDKCESLNTDDEEPRRRKVSKKLDEHWQTQHHHINPEEKYRSDFYFEVLDILTQEIDRRFSQECQSILESFSALQPSQLYQDIDRNLKRVTLLSEFYNLDASEVCSEYRLLKEHEDIQTCTTSHEVQKMLRTSGLHQVYRNVHNLYRILATIPVTSASCERSFSKLALIKNKLRSTMGQERLESLTVLAVEKDVTEALELGKVVDRFAAMSERRKNFE